MFDKTWDGFWKDFGMLFANPFNSIRLRNYFVLYDSLSKRYKLRTVLDAGSGTGLMSMPLATARGRRVVLLDLSPRALEISKKLYRSLNLKAEFVRGDIFYLPFKRGVFDLVQNQGVLEHFSSKDAIRILKEMRSVGKVSLVVVPYWRNIGYLLAKLYCRVFHKPWPFGSEVERAYKEHNLISEFQEAGVEVKSIRKIGNTGGIEAFLAVLLKSSPLKTLFRSFMSSVTVRRSHKDARMLTPYSSILVKLGYFLAITTNSKDSLCCFGLILNRVSRKSLLVSLKEV